MIYNTKKRGFINVGEARFFLPLVVNSFDFDSTGGAEPANSLAIGEEVGSVGREGSHNGIDADGKFLTYKEIHVVFRYAV